jgi:HSP20 family protein
MKLQLMVPRFGALDSELDRLTRELFGNFDRVATTPAAGAWIPPVDIVETAEALELRADLPGFKATDLNIEVEKGVLTIRGERKDASEGKAATYHTYERRFGTFVRSFALPRQVDAERVDARYVDGVLQVVLPKKEEAKPRTIAVRAA